MGKSVPGDDDDESQWTQTSTPVWFDEQRFRGGCQFFKKHMNSVLFSYLMSLVVGFNLDVFLQTLLFTGQSSTPEISSKRYFATLLYILQWYDKDVTNPSSKGYQSLMRVRKIHHHVRRALDRKDKQVLLDFVDHRREDALLLTDERQSGPGARRESSDSEATKTSEDEVDYIELHRRPSTPSSEEALPTLGANSSSFLDSPKLYLNQYEMALVQAAFVAPVVLYPSWIGINAEEEELAEYIYTWRVFGHFLGIKDDFNLCSGRFEEVVSLVGEIRDFELIPAIQDQSPDANRLIRSFLRGTRQKFRGKTDAFVFLSEAAIISFSQRPLNLEAKYEPKDLTYFDVFSMWTLYFFFKLVYFFPWFRKMVNSILSLPNVMKLIT